LCRSRPCGREIAQRRERIPGQRHPRTRASVPERTLPAR
jgi:hypothetical protein